MGIKLFPWQEWLLKHALELNEDGTYRFRYVIILVARQNGKSLLLLVLALWHLFAVGSPEVIATAQDLSRAEAAWKEALDWCEADEELASLIGYVNRGNHKVFEVEPDEEIDHVRKYRVAAAGRRGARGFSGDLVLMDELREQQNWETWGAVTNTMNARPWGQAWAFSNAGDNLSIVLRYLRAQAHQELGWPDGDADKEILGDDNPELMAFIEEMSGGDTTTGFFEYSSDPKSARTDIEQLAQANPSMDHTEVTPNCITARALIAALKTTPPWQFDTECRCIWVPMSDLGPFPEGSWNDTYDDSARPAPDSPQVVCVAVSKSRSKTYIARAGWDENGVPVVGIAADRAGTDWVCDWLAENRSTFEYVVVQDKGAPVASIHHELEAALEALGGARLPLLKWPAPDIAAGTGILFDRLERREVRHLTHPGLDAAAMSAAVRVLSRSAFEVDPVKSPTDVQPLQAIIGALWALEAVPRKCGLQMYTATDEQIEAWMAEDEPDWLKNV